MAAARSTKSRTVAPPWYRTHRGRRWAFAAAILAAYLVTPFISIGGQPLLGFDRHALRLYVGGVALWMDDLFLVLLATLLVVALILLLTVWLGRVWCGWACPQTVVLDVRDALQRLFRIRGRDSRAMRLTKRGAVEGIFFVVTLIGTTAFLWYFYPPGEFFGDLTAWRLPGWAWATWLILFGLFYGELLWLGRRFCTRACPYAKLQGVLFDRATLVVEYDRTRDPDCIDCKKCIKVCPTEIDIRDGLQVECIACGECIDACDEIMAKVGSPPKLIQFTFGSTSEPKPRVLRPAVVAMAVACVALTVILTRVAIARPAVEVSALRDRMHLFHVARDGRLMNSYTAVIGNRTDVPQVLTLWAEGLAGLELITPSNPVTVAPGTVRKVRFVLVHHTWQPLAAGDHPVKLRLLTEADPPVEATTATTFTVPSPDQGLTTETRRSQNPR
jgi:cytochrome c oxidase accessory protein FixG